ncbi:unnamed protein product [Allacma fusca]|uniref:Uncharacterized protein n=1 Tax=Allacma fusca TaxID=39272 RepID=A0A8J2Q1V7_9HEXA|nr:unnamed protein product [Allacma fusca]
MDLAKDEASCIFLIALTSQRLPVADVVDQTWKLLNVDKTDSDQCVLKLIIGKCKRNVLKPEGCPSGYYLRQ